jgi:hypothetical protein
MSFDLFVNLTANLFLMARFSFLSILLVLMAMAGHDGFSQSAGLIDKVFIKKTTDYLGKKPTPQKLVEMKAVGGN